MGSRVMITRKVLAELLESLGEEHVLSVYLAAEATDPAARRSWHVRLKNRTRENRVHGLTRTQVALNTKYRYRDRIRRALMLDY